MITKKHWLKLCELISDARASGKEVRWKDHDIKACFYKDGYVVLDDDTALNHKSFHSVKDVKRQFYWKEYICLGEYK